MPLFVYFVSIEMTFLMLSNHSVICDICSFKKMNMERENVFISGI